MSAAEQSRLLNEVPKAIPDIEVLEHASGDSSEDDKQVDNGSPRTILIETTRTPDNLEGKSSSMSVKDDAGWPCNSTSIPLCKIKLAFILIAFSSKTYFIWKLHCVQLSRDDDI